MNQEALLQAIQAIAGQLKEHPELLSQHLGTLQAQFPGVTEEQVKAAVARLAAGGMDAKGVVGVAKGLFGK